MHRKAKVAHLHNKLFIPGVIGHTNEKTLDPKHYPGMEIYAEDGGWVLIKYKGEDVLVPGTNFHALPLEKAESPKKEVKEKTK